MCGVPEDRRWIVGVLTSVLTGCTQPFYSVLSTLCPFEPFLPRKRLVSGENGQHSELARREKRNPARAALATPEFSQASPPTAHPFHRLPLTFDAFCYTQMGLLDGADGPVRPEQV